MKSIKKHLFAILLLTTTNYSLSQYLYISNAEKLPSEINSLNEESFPLIDRSNNLLYFTRTVKKDSIKGNFDQDIWVSDISDTKTYKDAQNIIGLNNEFNNSVLAITQKGNRLYLLHTVNGKKGIEKGIAVSNKLGNNWSSPTLLKIPNLSQESDFYGMFINSDESVMILSIADINSLGQEDLFAITFEGNSWSTPINLGNKINSTGFEISPFMLGDTLFFSSNGHGGFGDADIFYSIKGETWTDWSEPVNLGDKINSKKFDAYFHYSNNEVFWSSNRDSNIYSSIYSANYEFLDSLQAYEEHKNVTVYNGTDGEITLNIKGGKGPFIYKWSNGSTDSNLRNIPKGTYSVIIEDLSGQSKSLTVEITQPDIPFEMIADTLKKGDDLGKLLNLKPIYFNLNKYDLREDSFEELDKIVDVLNKYPKMKIEVGSHTDCRGSKQFNFTLSVGRAKSTVLYIQKRITNPWRVTGKGYGESRLINNCPCEGKIISQCSDEEHQNNRRSEFIIISK